ncbi:two-component sensor histidine kinase [Chelativorans sp. ZYF759]|uniref:ATP-binding protein n=1 Tax=Chelativorans sp. ZYF759 TaxID=2692213 RepID=UPI00145DD3F3|nr:ATP-binding protein [Chelativorans sp. ZYF759]NMG37800.1 two-component sensor histidine kinase [Chelativorans sp. ZYF759]
MRSMRARLLLILLVTTGAAWLSAAGWIYFSTQAQVEQVLDARLREAARMVDSLLTDERIEVASAAQMLPEAGIERDWGAENYSRQLSCQIWSLSGEMVGRSEAAPRQRLAGEGEGFSQTVVDGETWRVYTVLNPGRGVQVMVGDNLKIRQSLVNGVMMGTLFPMTLMLPVGGLLIWLAVRGGLAPLDRMARALSARRADDLRPVGDESGPAELRPMLAALNGLFARVEAAREREKSFTAFAAHELRTPLAGVKTQAQIALASKDPEVRARALAQIAGGVDRSSRLVSQLLDLAAADASEDDLPPEPADLGRVLEDAKRAVEPLRQRSGVTFAVAGNLDGRVACNEPLATTALKNVLENALLHSPDGGCIAISTASGDGLVSVVVEDEGPGMNEDDIEHAAERFFRGQTPLSSGTGLGLAIVETVLKRAGGTLAIANRPGGRGLTVSLTFPAA